MKIDPKAPVLVTGATGYVAGWLVKALVERGHAVHAAVRDPSKKDKLRHLDALAAKGPGSVRYFKSDLLVEGSYADAMQGCELVFHTASPFVVSVEDTRKELIEPAQLGTRNVLEQANRVAAVKRVVVTSSCAAIYGDNADLVNTPNGVLTEEHWNATSTADHQAYSFSKTVAEREAWEISRKQQRWQLVVVNPCMVMGPGLTPDSTSESFRIMRQMGDGTMKYGAPRMGIGFVDVRDVAEAHCRIAFSESATGRYIVAGHNSDIYELADILRPKFGDRYPIPRWAIPKWVAWAAGPLANKAFTRRLVSRNLGLPLRVDNGKGVRELGLTYRPLEQTVVEMFQQLADSGVFEGKR